MNPLSVDDHKIYIFLLMIHPPYHGVNLIRFSARTTGYFTEEIMQQNTLMLEQKKLNFCSSNDADQMVVFGVNHHALSPQTKSSLMHSTTNCLAPLVKCLHESMQITSGIINTIHAATNDQTFLIIITLIHTEHALLLNH